MSLYAFTGDPMFKDKAQYVADKLIPAFQTPTGVPNALVNTKTGVRFRTTRFDMKLFELGLFTYLIGQQKLRLGQWWQQYSLRNWNIAL